MRWESDVHEPEKYGIYQSVGDTAGPGGMVRALRTIPMICYNRRGNSRLCATGMGYQLY